MAENIHVIGKTSMALKFNQPMDGWTQQQKSSQWVHGFFLPALHDWFSELPQTRQYVSVDKISLSVLLDSAENWQEEALRKIKDQLMLKLSNLTVEPPGETQTIETVEARFFRVWLHFLATGVLPQLASEVDFSVLENEAIFKAQLETIDVKKDFQTVILNPDAQIRLIRSSSPQALAHVFSYFMNVPQAFLAQAAEEIKSLVMVSELLAKDSTTRLLIEAQLVRLFFIALLKKLSKSEFLWQESFALSVIAKWMDELYKQDAPIQWALKKDLKKSLFSRALESDDTLREKISSRGKKPFTDSPEKKAEAFQKLLQQLWQQERDQLQLIRLGKLQASTFQTQQKQGSKDSQAFHEGTSKHRDTDAIHPENFKAQHVEASDESSEKAVYYIANAGVVILAPFLPTFFERNGLYEPKNRHLQSDLAALLMHYLCAGKETAEEYELVFEKVLCGVEIKQALVLSDHLDDSLKQASEELLRSVIEHWSVLKNTTPEGLRNAFLMRHGKLEMLPQEEWRLIVEQKSYDMLIEQLPWGFSTIKLPWMKDVVKTRWV